MRHVVLWDIDGTLLTTARAGVFALEEALHAVCGLEADLAALQTSGLTDFEVAELAIETARGAPAAEAEVNAFLRAYETRLPACLPRRKGAVLPQVKGVLGALADRGDVLSLLLTGNTEAGARAKLEHYGLDGCFDGGAFCRGGQGRETIARHAMEIVEGLCDKSRPDSANVRPTRQVLVIGDTPHDLRAARAIGARTILLATGTHSLSELRSLHPWRAFEQLPPPAPFLELIDSLGRDASIAESASA
ncbi:MAG: HAD family hydrolase [Solirubrobacteraceae bacterium]